MWGMHRISRCRRYRGSLFMRDPILTFSEGTNLRTPYINEHRKLRRARQPRRQDCIRDLQENSRKEKRRGEESSVDSSAIERARERKISLARNKLDQRGFTPERLLLPSARIDGTNRIGNGGEIKPVAPTRIPFAIWLDRKRFVESFETHSRGGIKSRARMSPSRREESLNFSNNKSTVRGLIRDRYTEKTSFCRTSLAEPASEKSVLEILIREKEKQRERERERDRCRKLCRRFGAWNEPRDSFISSCGGCASPRRRSTRCAWEPFDRKGVVVKYTVTTVTSTSLQPAKFNGAPYSGVYTAQPEDPRGCKDCLKGRSGSPARSNNEPPRLPVLCDRKFRPREGRAFESPVIPLEF